MTKHQDAKHDDESAANSDALFRITAKAVLFGPDGRVLLLTRAKGDKRGPGKRDLPGGHVDPGETPEETVRREVLEETGLTVTDTAPLPTFAVFKGDDGSSVQKFRFVAFTEDTEVKTDPAEHSAHEWLTPDEAIAKLSDKGYEADKRDAVIMAKEYVESKTVARYGNVPETIVGSLILNREGKVLLAKGVKWDSKYVIFGGHVDFGETVENAVKREAREEAGIEVTIIDQLRFSDYITDKGHYTGRHMVFLDFLCRYEGEDDDVKFNDEYTGEYGWYTLSETEQLDLGGGTPLILENYRAYLAEHEALNGWKRCLADFDNYKKRQEASQKEMGQYLVERLLNDLIPVLDNFHAAASHVPEESKDSPWVVGIGYIEKQLEDTLAQHGVTAVDAKEGDPFDPSRHEALSDESEEGNAEDKGHKIAKVLQKGYQIGGKVVRAAKVSTK
ncbi:MAG: nucleotide exchange factor GrpE [Candidatus Moranbacteria bacterium]|nr:nucleotide exchange factor GrpE [Candidatus Moranbacteria bacterium]